MPKLSKQLSKKLKAMRGTATQREFARKLGTDAGTLNRLEQGRQNITLATIQKFCDRLKCGIADLFENDE